MTATVEFSGRDLAEAIAAAAAALNLPPEKLKFDVIEMGAKGFLGLGRRRARIAVDRDDPALDLSEDGPAPPAPGEPETRPEPEPAEGEGSEGPPSPVQARGPEGTEKKTARGKGSPAPPQAPGSEGILTRPAAGETRVDNPDDETARLARTVVEDIISRLGLAADLALVRLGSRLVVNLDGPDRAILIGARGATLEALQLLAAKIVAKKRPGEGDRLVLDVADYRFRRHGQVMENLRRQVEAARRTGRPQALAALSAAERRLVRLALRPCKDLEIRAGRNREGLVLAPAAPEPGARRRKKMKGVPR
jgi:spoIIIJ-associated protein